MKQLRITPLNIASALLVTWMLWQIMDEAIGMGIIGWFLLLLLVLVGADQFFRLMLGSLKRVWMAEGVFLLFVVLAIWILNVW
ncbi:hypothetical protein SAMN05421747_102201 [Parapedobacter composti]|uniref:Uncharacterized protein n=1 Tax=Parapedobacter composti TaxID=623281 RepID=A0A1I1F2P2_9SPHI|nr:hypothetical protein [Parapedobacter composti]SFB93527.1 hypothetical protein SAMN05421747_102201 [Parapedobacter composti]